MVGHDCRLGPKTEIQGAWLEQGWCMVGARGMFGARLGQGCPNHALCPNHAPTLPQIFRVFAPTIPQPCPNHTSVDDQIIKGSPKTLSQHTRQH